jgi:hypothetical protein
MRYILNKKHSTGKSTNIRLNWILITHSGGLRSIAACKTSTGDAGKQLHYKYAPVAWL